MSEVSVVAPPAVAASPDETRQASRLTPAPRLATIDLVAMLLVTLLAAVPRTVNLLGLDPFVDEVSTVDWALRQFEVTSPRTWLIPVLTDGRPPLFTWLIVLVGAVVDNGILAGRLVSAAAGALSAAALYLLGRELASRTVGVIAAILWALSPFTIFFARISADDALLTLLAILATWASVRLARQPTIATGAVCGLLLALTVLAKTNGVLLAIGPPLAIVMLGRPLAWRTYVRPLGAAIVAGLIASVPLLFGVVPMLQQVSLHTGDRGRTGLELLSFNVQIAAGWMESYVGNRFLLLVGAGAVLALVFRQIGLLFVAALGVGITLFVLEVSSSMFARYLLPGSFPAFLLAAYAINRVAALAVCAVRLAGMRAAWARNGVVAVVIALGLAVALEERADLAVAMVRDPARALIPGSEHNQYVENWHAVYGLARVVEELRFLGRDQPVTVLVPPASREIRVLVPYGALRTYLRNDTAVRIVEAPSLWRAQDLRDLRQFTRDGPTYLVVSGSYTPAAGMPNDVPAYTRQLERRLAQDHPEAREVLRIPRPVAANWLSLYRLDSGE